MTENPHEGNNERQQKEQYKNVGKSHP